VSRQPRDLNALPGISESVARFAQREIAPHVSPWDDAGEFSRQLYPQAAELGGMGFMRGTRSEPIYREVKVMTIGGGGEAIMKDPAARQLGP
jgi:alkylation response protein AidB-like acyl-CoA dehydrogenase